MIVISQHELNILTDWDTRIFKHCHSDAITVDDRHLIVCRSFEKQLTLLLRWPKIDRTASLVSYANRLALKKIWNCNNSEWSTRWISALVFHILRYRHFDRTYVTRSCATARRQQYENMNKNTSNHSSLLSSAYWTGTGVLHAASTNTVMRKTTTWVCSFLALLPLRTVHAWWKRVLLWLLVRLMIFIKLKENEMKLVLTACLIIWLWPMACWF